MKNNRKDEIEKQLRELKKKLVNERMKERLAPDDKTLGIEYLRREYKNLEFELAKLNLYGGKKK